MFDSGLTLNPLTISFVFERERKKGRKKWREQLCRSYAGRERYLSLKRVARKSVGTNAKRPRNSIYPMFRAHGRIKLFISISLPNFLWCPDHLVPIGAYKPPRNRNEIDKLGSLRDPNCIPCIDTEPPERRKEREEREERERKNHAIWFQSTHIQKKKKKKEEKKEIRQRELRKISRWRERGTGEMEIFDSLSRNKSMELEILLQADRMLFVKIRKIKIMS